MTDAVEVAIELALMDRAKAFATAQGLSIALPNIEFTPPEITPNAKYLRASLLPADTAVLGVAFSATNQHLGLMQLDVFYGKGGGEIAARRIAAAIISYFIRGTRMTSNGFNVEVLQTPRIGPSTEQNSWLMLPVRIPYKCFAIPA